MTVIVTNVDEEGVVTLSSAQPQVGAALSATLTDPDGSVSGVTWQWASSPDGATGWSSIDGAVADSYTPVAGDAGSYLRVTASYADPQGSGKSAQAVSANAVPAPREETRRSGSTPRGSGDGSPSTGGGSPSTGGGSQVPVAWGRGNARGRRPSAVAARTRYDRATCRRHQPTEKGRPVARGSGHAQPVTARG